jgi:hypothetical protein
MDAATLRDRVTRKLIEDIEEVQYPSVTMMDRVEAVLPTEALGDYAEALLDKIEGSRFPSISMLNRLDGLIGQLEQAEARSNGARQTG